MSETYCGKNCETCNHNESLSCPGCKAGPGGTCSLAKCCRQKGHEDCSTCSFSGACHLLSQKDMMPRRRQMEQDAKRAREESLKQRAAFFSKWLWPLFWLVIPSIIAGIMTNDTIIKYFPSLFVSGYILKAVTTITYGAILLRLSKEEDMYRIPGIAKLFSGSAIGICAVLFGITLSDALIFSLPIAILSLIGEYMEITAHSSILSNIDGELSDHWTLLWKWNIGLYGALLGSVLLVGIIGRLLCLLVLLAAGIGLVVVEILKLVYLYQTANVFSDLLRESESGLGLP